MRAPNTYSDSRHDYGSTPLGINWIYNNTFGTPSNGNDGVLKGVDTYNATVVHCGDHPHAMHNNIYRAQATRTVVPYTLNSTELELRNNNADNIWHDHNGPTGAYNSSPANGKPWLIGFGPGEYASGLGFVLKAGSPAINKGTRVHKLRYANDDVHAELRNQLLTDALGRPFYYVDDPVNEETPDAGAYQFNAPQVPGAPRYYNNPGHPAHGAWIPGTTLPQEFIEGQPWEKYWMPVSMNNIQLEFIDSSSEYPVEKLKVTFRANQYTTDSLGLTSLFETPDGYFKISLEDSPWEVSGDDLLGVFSDSVIRVYVKELPRYSVELQFLDSLSGAPLAGLELWLTDSTYVTDSQGMILIPELFEGSHTLSLPDQRFLISGDPVIEVSSDTVISILVTKLRELTLQVINRTTGSPLYRAAVNVNDAPTYYSDRSGLVEVGEFPAGPFHVSVSFSGYFYFSDTLFFSGDSTMVLSLTPEYATVTFRVSDTTGPLSNAKVIMTGSQLTNFSGQALFFNQPARKNYAWSIEKAGYSMVQDSLYLEIDTTLEVSLEKVVGISDKDVPDWIIYPNPFDSYIQINLQEKAELKLYDISGVLRLNMKLEEGLNRLPVENLAEGFYMMEIVSSDWAYRKVMVKH